MQRVPRKPAAQVVRLLARGVEGVAAVRGIIITKVRPRLQRICREAIAHELELDHLCGFTKRLFRPAPVAAFYLEHEVGAELLVHQRRIRDDRLPQSNDRRQRLVIHLHRGGCLFRGKAAFRHDCRNHVADVTHYVACKGRPRRAVHGPSVAEVHRMDHGELTVSCLHPVQSRQSQEHPRQPGSLRYAQ
jgi:hypothetical protein